MLYWFANLVFQSDFLKEIKEILKNKKSIIVVDVGCYRGVFTKKILHIFNRKIKHAYLFDVNKKVKNYLRNLLKTKIVSYNELALTKTSGVSFYYYNKFFESAGSSLSNLVKNDRKWNFSRRILIGNLKNKDSGYSKYKVKTSTLDNFVKKNKIKYIDICKVDIEGTELDFLLGSRNILKENKIKILSIEIMENKKKFYIKEKKIKDLLVKNNFKLIKKNEIRSISFLSNLKGGDYLFLNKKYQLN